MIFSLQSLIALEMQYQYTFLFPAMVIEGPIVAFIGGFLVSLGYLQFGWVYFFAVLGDLVGDTILYLVGRFGGAPLLRRYGSSFGVTAEKVERLKHHFTHHRTRTIFFGKATHGFGAAVLATAGALHMPYAEFLVTNLVFTAFKSFLFVGLGFFAGHAYERANSVLNIIALGTVFLALLAILVYLVPRKLRKKYRSKL